MGNIKGWARLLGVMMLANLAAPCEGTVRFAIGEWPPYTSESDPKGKLAERIVTEALRQEGLEVSYEYFPWKRSYALVEGGEFDGTFPWNRTPERDRAFQINTIPLVQDEGVFFHLTSTAFDWKSIEDLKKYRIGVTIGFKQEKTYRANGILADTAPSEEKSFLKLMAGRIDVYETSKVVGHHTINRLFPPEKAKLFTTHPIPVESNAYYVLFSRTNPHSRALAARLDSGLRKLMKSGAYKSILADYNVNP